jgi:hypothetical protein
MFKNIRTRWQEARGAHLKEEFLDVSRRMNGFTEEHAKHFGLALDSAFRFWIKNHGLVKDTAIKFRKSSAKELRTQATGRYDKDIGASYALAVFSFHVESSYLPGEDANFVYDKTTYTISLCSGLVARQPI